MCLTFLLKSMGFEKYFGMAELTPYNIGKNTAPSEGNLGTAALPLP